MPLSRPAIATGIPDTRTLPASFFTPHRSKLHLHYRPGQHPGSATFPDRAHRRDHVSAAHQPALSHGVSMDGTPGAMFCHTPDKTIKFMF